MTDIGSPIFQWLNAHPQLAGLLTFLISAGESVAIIGTIVPGSIMMTAIGTLAGAGVIPLYETIIWAILGAIVGDSISYWLGHYFKDKLPRYWPFRNNPNLLKTGEKFVHKYGTMSVFIGRFVGPVRALVPMVAGMLGMAPSKFIIANVTSAIGWAPAYMLPGILLGAAAQELPPDIAMHVILVLLLIVMLVMLCLWVIYKLSLLVQTQTTNLLNRIWHHLKESRILRPITVVLRHHDPHKTYGQLNLAFKFVITSALLVCLIWYVKTTSASNIMFNDALYHLFRSIRQPNLDVIMLNITLLGQKEVVLPIFAVLFAWFLYCKRWRMAFHVISLGVLAAGSAYLLKILIKSPRPWGIFQNAETFSMPSGHAVLSTSLYMGLAFLLATSVQPTKRWLLYTAGVVLTAAVGISRIYLGAHWFTDVLASWLLSAAIIMLIVISYERRKEAPINPASVLLVCVLTLCPAFYYYHHKHFTQLEINYAQVNWPRIELANNEWWNKNDALPAYRASLFGFPSQRINISWAGSLDDIKDTLTKQGWGKPPARNLISTLHRITDINSTQYLPMVSLQYLDQTPALILTRVTQLNGDKHGLLVIRLWDSNRIVQETKEPIWVGVIAIVPRTYTWLYKKNPADVTITPNLIFPLHAGTEIWKWKIMKVDVQNNTKHPIIQNMLMIKPKTSTHK